MQRDGTQPRRETYLKARKAGSITLNVKSAAERAHYHEFARAAGYARFSDSIHMLVNAANGQVYPPEYADRPEKDAEKHRAWVMQKGL